jgi:hypothetical protein
MCVAFSSSKIFVISKTSLGRRTKLAAIKSTSFSIPKRISAASFSVIPGKLMLTLGTLTPFLFFKAPSFNTFVTISLLALSNSITSKSTKPSSNKI